MPLPDHKVWVHNTPTIPEISCVKNVKAIVVFGFLIKYCKKYGESMKKIVGAVWELPAK